MLRKIHLHGSLKGPDYTGPIEVLADTIGEAIKAVSTQHPSFRPNAKRGYVRIKVLGCDKSEDLFVIGGEEDIHVFPQFCGGKKGGFMQILIGAALIAASFLPGLEGIQPLLIKLGAMLIIGGLLQMMTAPKRDKKDAEQNKSYYLGAPKNTVEIGTRIPIPYGRRRVGGQYLSFNITSTDTGL